MRGRTLGVALVLLVGLPAGSAQAAESITVTLTAGGARFSKVATTEMTVTFVVRNATRTARSFSIAGKRTKPIARGRQLRLAVRLPRVGTYPWAVIVHGHVTRRGTFRLVEDDPPGPALTLVGRFAAPTDVDAPPADDRRVVVVEQAGLIRLLLGGELQAEPFLDLRDRVLENGEAGLLSIAFHPGYAQNGLAYVFHNDRAGNINVVEFRRSEETPDRLDPSTARSLLYAVKFAPNHNGGMLQFGPDGGLYVSIGDGGSTAEIEPGALVQADDTPWGKLLRMDPATGATAIWARGFRNPWRFWIDRTTSEIYVGDVGQDRREEIDLIPASTPGLNFGWPCYEGTLVFDPAERCAAVVAPIFEYEHGSATCSLTGGVVARDARLPQLAGSFLFADFCGGALRALRRTGGTAAAVDLGLTVPRPTGFGVDGLERIYVASSEGPVYRIDPSG